MPRPSASRNVNQKITPLWIVAAFVTLTEMTVVYAVTQVQAGIQVALTVFAIGFAVSVGAAFFVILWNRPWVFYAPSEYGDVDPKHFMSALRESPNVATQVELVRSVEENPMDEEARFALIDTMADEVQGQFLIFMHESGHELPQYVRYAYEMGRGLAGMGTGAIFEKNKLAGTGLVRAAGGGRYFALTEQGHKFAQWLVNKGRKCSYFWCDFGSWGDAKHPSTSEWVEKQTAAGSDGEVSV